MWKIILSLMLTAVLTMSGCGEQSHSLKTPEEFLNVSYDPTREFFVAYNQKFQEHWRALGGSEVKFTQFHGGSGNQVKRVLSGLAPDVVTLALSYDVDEIQRAGLINEGWIKKFPDNSAPYTSTIVFLVRAGNPKNILDWDDLVRDDVLLVMPNPKTSGGARWIYLAAWQYARERFDDDEILIRAFVGKILSNVFQLDVGARGATDIFVKNKHGDVMIAWENEALLVCARHPDDYELVVPSLSILAEPAVAVVDAIVDRKGSRAIAEEYVRYLYSAEGQEIAAQNFYRPRDPIILEKYSNVFCPLKLFTIEEAFGSWSAAQREHFSDGGTFDQLYEQ